MKRALIQHGFINPNTYSELVETFPDPPAHVRGFRSPHDLSDARGGWANLPDPWQELRRSLTHPRAWERILEVLQIGECTMEDYDPDAREAADGTPPSHCAQYPRVDIGWGGVGYGKVNGGKGNHIDNATRVVSGLIYFSDQSDFEGGEFEFTTEDGELVHRVPVRENLCIMSAQDREGWHRVNPVTAAKTWRRAVYFALSDNRNVFGR